MKHDIELHIAIHVIRLAVPHVWRAPFGAVRPVGDPQICVNTKYV